MKRQKATYLSTSFLHLIARLSKVFIIAITLLPLTACIFSENTAPVSDLSRGSSSQHSVIHRHTVKSGETLYSIAWRYDVDFKDLAAINNIGSDFLIYAGQVLLLSAQDVNASSSLPAARRPNSASVATTKPPFSQAKPSSTNNVPRKNDKQPPSLTAISSRSEKKPTAKKTVATSKLSPEAVIWRWPGSGRVITNFSSESDGNKGIDLDGKKGDSVNAAASGRIVYAGSGLRGYGKLIIIKHNDTFLSAYAHNDRIRVKEGQNVKAGQHIADIGSSGSRTDTVRLHFEIRRNGQPVNPLTLLPKRKT
jgi:lipoprotein NlpD